MTARPPAIAKVAWWRRLELRVVASLVALGIVCVGASAYLVGLTVAYFDARLADALDRGRDVAESVEPFHDALVRAHVSAFEARAHAMAATIAAAPDDAELRRALADHVAAEPDVLAIAVVRPGGARVEAATPQRDAIDPLLRYELEVARADGGALQVAFAIDPEIDARYQALGGRLRDIERSQRSQADVESAVERVLAIASLVVLAVALAAGVAVARTMTRKVTALSSVMQRVAHGDLTARAGARGHDELDRLAEAFDRMLDELAAAQDKLAYLQRIGAWQGMARRIAHEIKNPLTPIQLAVQQIRDKDPRNDPEFSRLLAMSTEIVQDEIDGLRRMVTSFSQFAKVPRVQLAETTVQRVFDEFSRAYGHLTDDGEALVVQAPDEPLAILADRQLLKQALVNLVENATLSAREAGRAAVRVEVRARRDGDDVVIDVDDNGPGIAADRREAVFEPYETTRRQGTGLGLAIVKKLVLDHGGTIAIGEAPLGGARVTIRLPAHAG